MEVIKRDILVLFFCNYMTSGSFYDSFEYFYLLRERGFDCGLLLMLNNTKEETLKALKDKYNLNNWEDIYKDIYFMSYTTNGKQKIIPYFSEIIIAPSMCSLATLLLSPYFFYFKKIFMMYEAPIKEPHINRAFGNGKFKDKIVLLGDRRCMIPFYSYKFIDYRKKLNFKLFKPIGESKDSCCINMTTEHKMWDATDLRTVMNKYNLKNYFIYCMKGFKNKTEYNYYKQLESNNIRVVEAPVDNFMEEFDKYLYLMSNRSDDPSPRLLAECIFYKKKVFFHDFGKLEDGAFYRWIDCNENFDSLVLKNNDELIEIIQK